MARARRNPTARAGNYAAPIDTAGMDPEMKHMLVPEPPMNKIEKDYLKDKEGSASAKEAIRRARKANAK